MMFRHKDDDQIGRLAAQLATDRRRRDADRLSQPGIIGYRGGPPHVWICRRAHQQMMVRPALSADSDRPSASLEHAVWIAVRREDAKENGPRWFAAAAPRRTSPT